MDFVAIDFETANAKRNSPCSIALSVVENNQIVAEFYSLIKPDTEFSWRNIQIHGITENDVKDAPSFPELWPHIKSFFTPDKLVVAHNAPFDVSVLKRTLEFYGIPQPTFNVIDTVKTSKDFFTDFENHKLDTICHNLNITLKNHHNALADCVACAQILLYQTKRFGEQHLAKYIKQK